MHWQSQKLSVLFLWSSSALALAAANSLSGLPIHEIGNHDFDSRKHGILLLHSKTLVTEQLPALSNALEQHSQRHKRAEGEASKESTELLNITLYNPVTKHKELEFVPASAQFALAAACDKNGSSLANNDVGELALLSYTLYKGVDAEKTGKKAEKAIAEFAKDYSLEPLLPEYEKEKLSDYTSLNDFFTRKLKESSRTLAEPENPKVAVSGADCRLHLFQTVSSATKAWIKGEQFSIKQLLGKSPAASREAAYSDGSMAIFRLAPQDYHRVHFPVDGKIKSITEHDGAYFSVNPQCVRSEINVFGRNHRTVIEVESAEFGNVVLVMVGATAVGSIDVSVKKGDDVKRGQEVGAFKFGGSTCIALWEKDKIVFDEKIAKRSRRSKAPIETLARVKETVIGRAVEQA